jgi:DNA-binding GntR family transcriptional regulator
MAPVTRFAPVPGKPTLVSQSSRLPRNLTKVAYESIRDAIVYGRFDFGEPLSETELAHALGMSKGPVRTALRELQVSGLVEIVPQSATYVFRATRAQIEHLGDFRFLLETEAMRLSMAQAALPLVADLERTVALMGKAAASGNRIQTKLLDTQFHQAFIRNSGNTYLISSYETIGQIVDALRYRVLDTIVYRNRAYEEHQRMLELLRSGKTRQAIAVLRKHIDRTKQFQGSVDWGKGRARRKDYKFRNYREALRPS